MSYLHFILVFLCLSWWSCDSSRSNKPNESEQAAQKVNIIYILADDLGYGDLGAYGQQLIKTPEIDKMAAEGMRFTDHYAGNTVCAPSRCALMTGYHMGHARITGNGQGPLLPEDITVAEVLKKAGYTTGIIGKWGLGEAGSTGVPTQQGFDYFYGYLNQIRAHNYYPDFLWENQEKVPLANEIEIVQEGYAKGIGSVSSKREQYSHDLFTEKALDFVEKNQTQPFFLYLAYTIPHANNEGRDQGMEVPDDQPYSEKDWPQMQKNHAAMISRMDTDVGKLLAKIRQLDLAENTIVFFSSDNGPHREGGGDPAFFDSNGPLKGIKRDLYEGGIRVPFIAWWPGQIPAGTESNHIAAFWDFMPTAADLADVSLEHETDGISFLPALLGKAEEQNKHDYLYWKFGEGNGSEAVRIRNWKGITIGQQPLEVYDLSRDLDETINLAGQEPEIEQQLQQVINNF
ncbi:MAG: arylsulfatase [Candidatus Cyclobacteriaceae bacterium M3_2C_046]